MRDSRRAPCQGRFAAGRLIGPQATTGALDDGAFPSARQPSPPVFSYHKPIKRFSLKNRPPAGAAMEMPRRLGWFVRRVPDGDG